MLGILLSLPDCHDIRHVNVVRLSASRTVRLYPQEMFLVLFVTRGLVDPRVMVRSEGNMSLKHPVTPPGIDPGTVRLEHTYTYIYVYTYCLGLGSNVKCTTLGCVFPYLTVNRLLDVPVSFITLSKRYHCDRPSVRPPTVTDG
jgi:hypothetical protein